MAKKKAKETTTQSLSDYMETHVEEFIPYACHFNPETVLTKNGELLQVIKITGFNYETVAGSAGIADLRSTIREAIKESIPNNDFALWIHTVRRNRDLSPYGDYPDGFSKDLHRAWCDMHHWKEQYSNELYISVLIEGQPLEMKNLKGMLRSLIVSREYKYRFTYLDDACVRLTSVTDSLLAKLSAFGAQRLAIFKNDGVYYSQISAFLSKLLNLEQNPVPLSMVDMSDVLPSRSLAFGFNTIQAQSSTDNYYASILTIKEYHEVASAHIDKILQLPQQFIITETFDFINAEKAKKEFDRLLKIQRIGEDGAVLEASGIESILEQTTDTGMEFGEHQISIMVYEPSLAKMETSLNSLLVATRELGIVSVREDIFLEDCYWSILPGNFEFIKRLSPISTSQIGGYASLNNFPAGMMHGNLWGPAITVFHTAAGTPYFFNFHYENCGHTMIVGPFGTGKTVLLNFLVSETMKFKPKLFYFDQHYGAEIFLRALDGAYIRVETEDSERMLRMNPFQMEDTTENRTFLEDWLLMLIQHQHADIGERDRTKIKEAVAFAYTLPEGERKLSRIIHEFWPPDESAHIPHAEGFDDVAPSVNNVANAFQPWIGQGEYAPLFDNAEDNLNLPGDIVGLEMGRAVNSPNVLPPLMFYLLQRIEQQMDGSPTLIVLDEAWRLLDNPVFKPHLESWTDRMRHKNAVVIFATESIEDVTKSAITSTLSDRIETKIFLPNPNADQRYMELFNISGQELHLLKELTSDGRQFMLKHHNDAIVAKLDLEKIGYALDVLSATEENITKMRELIVHHGAASEAWLPAFKKAMTEEEEALAA